MDATYTLAPEQVYGKEFLKQRKRVLLCDDVGVGKTPQAVVAASETDSERILFATKKSLMFQATEEIARWTADTFTEYTVDSKELTTARFTVTNYNALLSRPILSTIKWDTVIIDEATAIKNRNAKRSKAFKQLTKNVPNVYLLTGTPIHNRPDELWHLLHVLNPKYFSSYWRFVFSHCYVEQNYWGAKEITGIKDSEGLAKVLEPYMLRRTNEVLNLPMLTSETIKVRMGNQQRKAYKDMEATCMTMLEAESTNGVLVVSPNVLSQLMRLRQIACSTAMLGGRDYSAKADALEDLLDIHAEYHKFIIFSNFRGFINILADRLQKYNPAIVMGGMKESQVADEVRNKFINDDGCRIMLCTIDAAGEGLNLQVADRVVFADLPWVPKSITQCVGRARRRGQDKPVHVYRLITDGTVDEYMDEVLTHKDEMIAELEAVNAVIQLMRKGGRSR